MGYASYLVWKQGGIEAQKRPLILYGLQLVANLCWPVTFFLRKKLGQAQIVNLGKMRTPRSLYSLSTSASAFNLA